MVSGKANSSSPGSDRRSERASARRSESGADSGGESRAGRRSRPPLDGTGLRDLALAYAARFATTGARLEAYLARKLRERGAADGRDGQPAAIDIPALVADLARLGYVDDAAYARMRARDLGARGYGGRRVEQALRAAGVGAGLRGEHAPGEADNRRAAALFARKRRFGPYGFAAEGDSDPLALHRRREKAIAAMLRAGHELAHARFILDAAGTGEIDDWLAECAAEEGREESW